MVMCVIYICAYLSLRLTHIIKHEASYLWDSSLKYGKVTGHWVHTEYPSRDYYRNETTLQIVATKAFSPIITLEVLFWKARYPLGSKWPYS